MKDLKLNMYISVLVLLSFIVAVIFIGSKSTKCANLAHDEWTEKDDEQAHKLAYPKPTKREENYFTENGLVRDKKRGKSHVAKFCQRCVLIVKDKLEEPEEKQQLSATCTVTTVNEELCGISSPAQEAGTFSNLEPIQTNTEAGTDDKSTTRSTLTSDQGTCSSVIDGLNLEQVTTPISTPSQESVLDSTPQNCNSFFEPGIITVLSTTVENALPETERVTKEFVRTFDKFFDVLNVRSYKKEALRKKKKNLREYDDPDDPRLQWLVGDFLKYLQDWENAVMARQNYTKKQKNKMLLPQETLTSLKRTALGASAAVKSLLREVEGVDYVLTERFNQDPLESLFGNFRQMNGGADTPNPQQINEMMNAARLRSTSMLKNFRGNTQQVQDYQEVNNTAIPKKKKKRYSEEK